MWVAHNSETLFSHVFPNLLRICFPQQRATSNFPQLNGGYKIGIILPLFSQIIHPLPLFPNSSAVTFLKSWFQKMFRRSLNDGPRCLMVRCPDPSFGAAIDKDMINLLVFHKDKEKYDCYLLRSYIEDNKKKLTEKLRVVCSWKINYHTFMGEDYMIKVGHDFERSWKDKQAALEKINWEMMTSNKKVEKLQEDLDYMQVDVSTFTLLLESLVDTDTAMCTGDYDTKPYIFNHVLEIDDMDEMEWQKMEEARKAYIVAVAVSKEKQDEEEFIVAAANARLHLQSATAVTWKTTITVVIVTGRAVVA
ncbi:hypothetical protein RYX36_006401, partial [Vicia faba]